MKRPLQIIFTTAFGLALFACGSGEDETDVDPVEEQKTFSLKVANQDPNDPDQIILQSLTRQEGESIMIDRAVVHATSIGLVLPEDRTCEEEQSLSEEQLDCSKNEELDAEVINVEGPFTLDMAAGTTDPAIPAKQVPSGSYDALLVELRLLEGADEITDPQNEDETIAASSFYLAGSEQSSPNEPSNRFELSSKETGTKEMFRDHKVEVGEDEDGNRQAQVDSRIARSEFQRIADGG